jgi:hypothetical protein
VSLVLVIMRVDLGRLETRAEPRPFRRKHEGDRMVVLLSVGAVSAADFDDRLDENLIAGGTGDDDLGVPGFKAQALARCG